MLQVHRSCAEESGKGGSCFVLVPLNLTCPGDSHIPYLPCLSSFSRQAQIVIPAPHSQKRFLKAKRFSVNLHLTCVYYSLSWWIRFVIEDRTRDEEIEWALMIVSRAISFLLGNTSYGLLIFCLQSLPLKSPLSGMFSDFSEDLKIQELDANNCF